MNSILSSQTAPEPTAPARRADRLLNGMRVLVIDGDSAVHDAAWRLLFAQGAAIDHAADLVAGVEKLFDAQRAYQVALVDGGLPAETLRWALERRCAPPLSRETVLIGMTEGARPAQGGFDEYVGKPLNVTELVASILWHAPRSTASVWRREGGVMPRAADERPARAGGHRLAWTSQRTPGAGGRERSARHADETIHAGRSA